YREYAHDVHGAGKHLLALINDILDLSKAAAGKFELMQEEVAPADIVAECVRLTRGKAHEGGLRLTFEMAPGVLNVVVDRLRFKQALLNLCSNAIKFTPPGGAVHISAHQGEDDSFILTVSDTGIGMSPAEIVKALDPFGQINSAVSGNQRGTGLGLSLAKMLTELHGGQLKIDSAPNAGTRVSIVLPGPAHLT
ncbi:MAG TPA: HAMP domain-containing sensor histidine kinase, partial [Terriglobales bacterium]|nr:HAMP domain-containing sensor histidine kinase [Terriglobales bacterium]